MKFRNTPVPPDVAVTVVTFRSRLGFAPFAPIPVDAVSVTTFPVTSVTVEASPSVMLPVRAVRVNSSSVATVRFVTAIEPPTTVTSSLNVTPLILTAPVPSPERPIVIEANPSARWPASVAFRL